ncbi:MAG TPA: hypothetical protein VLH19_04615 [Patescibacteria group bacterium]|nr:hypothetical protein [Patescibacteria group bacterium]
MPENIEQTPEITAQTSKPNTLSLALILLVLILLGVSGFLAYQNMQLQKQLAMVPVETQATAASPTPTTDPTANWKTYTNSALGISFKYPNIGTITNTYSQPKSGQPTFIVSNKPYFDPTKLPSCESGTKQTCLIAGKNWNQTSDVETITLADKNESSFFVAVTNSDGGTSVLHVVQTKNPMIEIVFSVDGAGLEETFQQILSTFKFTCKPRPACLDATPRCMIPETADMCPQTTPQTYTCPANGWVDCMPVLDAARQVACSKEAMVWYKANCSNFQGAAL